MASRRFPCRRELNFHFLQQVTFDPLLPPILNAKWNPGAHLSPMLASYLPHLRPSWLHVAPSLRNLTPSWHSLPYFDTSWPILEPSLAHLGIISTIFGPSCWIMVSNLTPRAYSGPSWFPQLTFQTHLGEQLLLDMHLALESQITQVRSAA